MFNFFKKSKKIEKNQNTQNKPIVFQDEQAKDIVLQIKPNGNDTLFEIINLKENNSILFEYGKTGNIIKTVSVIYDESEEKNG